MLVISRPLARSHNVTNPPSCALASNAPFGEKARIKTKFFVAANGRAFRVAVSRIMMFVGPAKASSRPSAEKAGPENPKPPKIGKVFVCPES